MQHLETQSLQIGALASCFNTEPVLLPICDTNKYHEDLCLSQFLTNSNGHNLDLIVTPLTHSNF